MKVQNQGYLSMEQLTDQYLSRIRVQEEKESVNSLSFRDILRQKGMDSRTAAPAGELKFSKHAMNRLNDRNIALDSSQLERLNDGARKAGEKGIRESLVLMDQLAFIVNVPSLTVVTAMDSTATDENIFTNINGAVIV